jgi:hypothetical protein
LNRLDQPADRSRGPDSGSLIVGLALSFIAASNETPSIIENYIPRNCRVRERRIPLIYDRSGALESLVEPVNVDLLCVKQVVVVPEILNPKLHDQRRCDRKAPGR